MDDFTSSLRILVLLSPSPPNKQTNKETTTTSTCKEMNIVIGCVFAMILSVCLSACVSVWFCRSSFCLCLSLYLVYLPVCQTLVCLPLSVSVGQRPDCCCSCTFCLSTYLSVSLHAGFRPSSLFVFFFFRLQSEAEMKVDLSYQHSSNLQLSDPRDIIVCFCWKSAGFIRPVNNNIAALSPLAVGRRRTSSSSQITFD